MAGRRSDWAGERSSLPLGRWQTLTTAREQSIRTLPATWSRAIQYSFRRSPTSMHASVDGQSCRTPKTFSHPSMRSHGQDQHHRLNTLPPLSRRIPPALRAPHRGTHSFPTAHGWSSTHRCTTCGDQPQASDGDSLSFADWCESVTVGPRRLRAQYATLRSCLPSICK